ncbi:MAG: sugar phosphate isomerase/epimerase family protein [Planctomycetota bacterium]
MITISAFADEIAQDLTEQMDICEANGVKCIDVRGIDGENCSKFSLSQVAEYKKRMDDRGFTMPCLGSPIGKIKMDDDFEAHLELLKHCADVTKAFGSDRIRMFSFYPSEGKKIADQREAVFDRMAKMIDVAAQHDVVLYHENEKGIYGARPAGVKDLLETFGGDHFKGIFDPANYVEEDVKPYDDGWSQGLAEMTDYFHIKDKVPGEPTCCPAGQGKGQFDEIFADLAKRDFASYMTLEPHMKAAGQFEGFTGPELFSKAVAALKQTLEKAGIEYRTY